MRLTNTPMQRIPMKLAARKSFSFIVVVRDSQANRIDLSEGYSARLVVRKNDRSVTTADAEALITSEAVLGPGVGELIFALQASELDLATGTYDYAITLYEGTDATGIYSLVLAQGDLEIDPNAEYDATGETPYSPNIDAAGHMVVSLAGNVVLHVATGGGYTPGTRVFRNADFEHLWSIEAGAQVNPPEERWLPVAGAEGEILKLGKFQQPRWVYDTRYLVFEGGFEPSHIPGLYVPSEYSSLGIEDMGDGFWNFVDVEGQTNDPLPAEGANYGQVPVADGAGGWGWTWSGVQNINGRNPVHDTGFLTLTLDHIPDGEGLDRYTVTAAQLAKINAALTEIGDIPWSSLTEVPDDLVTRGTVNASTDISEGVLDAARVPRVTALNGITYGTAAPPSTGVQNGDIYIQYTA